MWAPWWACSPPLPDVVPDLRGFGAARDLVGAAGTDLLRGTVRVAEAAGHAAGRRAAHGGVADDPPGGPVSRRCSASSAMPRPASPWAPMGTCSPTSRGPRRPAWRTPARMPWRAGHGPGADQRPRLYGKAQVSEAIQGRRRRDSNPQDSLIRARPLHAAPNGQISVLASGNRPYRGGLGRRGRNALVRRAVLLQEVLP